MPEKNYQDRDVLEKLGIKQGHAVAFVNTIQEIDQDLSQRIIERTGRAPATEDEALDIVLAVIDEMTDTVALPRNGANILRLMVASGSLRPNVGSLATWINVN